MGNRSKYYAKIQVWLGIPSILLGIAVAIMYAVSISEFIKFDMNDDTNAVLSWTSAVVIWFLIIMILILIIGIVRLVFAVLQIVSGSHEHNTMGMVAGIFNIIMPFIGFILSIVVWAHPND